MPKLGTNEALIKPNNTDSLGAQTHLQSLKKTEHMHTLVVWLPPSRQEVFLPGLPWPGKSFYEFEQMFYMPMLPSTQRSQRTLNILHRSHPPLWGRYYPCYLQMGKFRHGEVTLFAQGHTVSQWLKKTESRCSDSYLHNPTTNNTSLNFKRALNK